MIFIEFMSEFSEIFVRTFEIFVKLSWRTNEIIWHKKEAIHAVDFMPYKYHVPQKTVNFHAATDGVRKINRLRAQGADKFGFRMATGGVDMMVR